MAKRATAAGDEQTSQGDQAEDKAQAGSGETEGAAATGPTHKDLALDALAFAHNYATVEDRSKQSDYYLAAAIVHALIYLRDGQ